MMKEEIINFWNIFQEKEGFRLFSKIKSQNVSLGYDLSGNRSMFIDIPTGLQIIEPHYELENLSFYIIKEGYKQLVISLKDENFNNIFNEFLFTIFSQIHNNEDVELVIKKIIEQYHVWSLFFKKAIKHSLNLRKLLGLAGELYFINYFLEAKLNPESILKNWTGPSNNSHDFMFDTYDLEVKSKLSTSNVIHISSSFQLDYDKTLELGVVSFSLWEEDDEENPVTLNSMIEDLLTKFESQGVDSILFLNKLLQLNINYFDEDQMKDFIDVKFIINGHQTYDASHPDFPRLVSNNIPPAIKKLKYDLDLNLIEEYTI